MSTGECELCSLILSDPQHTHDLAAQIAAQAAPGDCLRLEGDLGVGKTTFARGFIQALAEESDIIASPTFTLVQSYPTRQGWPVWHFDLYRLAHPRDLESIGLDEALQTGVSLIEWPKVASSMLPPQSLRIRLAYGRVPDERLVTCVGLPEVWESRLRTMIA